MRTRILPMVRRFLVVPLFLTAVVVHPSARSSEQPSPGAEACSAEYTVGPEDVLDIAVWNNTEISRTVPVRPDGKISLPLLNDVQASGFTPMQLRDTLAKSLAEYIAAPNVSVIVREVHSFKVTVIGEVKTPGRFELKGRATVLDVLALAGGLTEFAARGRIVVVRQGPTGTRQIPFPYDKLIGKNEPVSGSKNNGQHNFCMQPGDAILVP
jgi:polysaccharide export outer membrane protein